MWYYNRFVNSAIRYDVITTKLKLFVIKDEAESIRTLIKQQQKVSNNLMCFLILNILKLTNSYYFLFCKLIQFSLN